MSQGSEGNLTVRQLKLNCLDIACTCFTLIASRYIKTIESYNGKRIVNEEKKKRTMD